MTSLDVQSHFTNVPVNEVINIIYDYATENHLQLQLPPIDLCNMLSLCISNVQFLFDGTYYRQIDGVAMGSPLGPVLADIFMDHLEHKARAEIDKTVIYERYVADIFVIGDSTHQINLLFDSAPPSQKMLVKPVANLEGT